jgi:hypothetical protein
MDKLIRKLRHYVGDAAEALVAVGLDTPRKIKAATDEQVKAAKGVGDATLAEIRKRMPKR